MVPSLESQQSWECDTHFNSPKNDREQEATARLNQRLSWVQDTSFSCWPLDHQVPNCDARLTSLGDPLPCIAADGHQRGSTVSPMLDQLDCLAKEDDCKDGRKYRLLQQRSSATIPGKLSDLRRARCQRAEILQQITSRKVTRECAAAQKRAQRRRSSHDVGPQRPLSRSSLTRCQHSSSRVAELEAALWGAPPVSAGVSLVAKADRTGAVADPSTRMSRSRNGGHLAPLLLQTSLGSDSQRPLHAFTVLPRVQQIASNWQRGTRALETNKKKIPVTQPVGSHTLLDLDWDQWMRSTVPLPPTLGGTLSN